MADPDGSGNVVVTSLKNLFVELGFSVSDEEMAPLLVDLDKSAKDTMNFSDFVKAAHLLDELKTLHRQMEGETFEADDIGEYEDVLE
mmetsp:Transcript_6514/g.10125  ORF Transcript_6514/g.10125 Transcript_6514/m.10125 type:complete len:87 (-) Transcript_6514:190-450(-)